MSRDIERADVSTTSFRTRIASVGRCTASAAALIQTIRRQTIREERSKKSRRYCHSIAVALCLSLASGCQERLLSVERPEARLGSEAVVVASPAPILTAIQHSRTARDVELTSITATRLSDTEALIAITLTARSAVSAANLWIALPTHQAESDLDRRVVFRGQPIRVPRTLYPIGSLRAGEQRRIAFPVNFPYVGNYKLGLAFSSDPVVRESADGRKHYGGFEEIWWMLARRGHTTVVRELPLLRRDGSIDTTMTPGAHRPRTNSLRPNICDPADASCVPPPPAPKLYGNVTFAVQGGSVRQGVGSVRIYLHKGGSLPTISLTDGSGFFLINECPAANQGWTLRAETYNSDINLWGWYQGQAQQIVASIYVTRAMCDQSLSVEVILDRQAEVFVSTHNVIAATRQFWQGQGTRGQVKIAFDENSTYPSNYDIVRDSISLNYPLYGDNLPYTVAHEYGHATHQTALGSISSFNNQSECAGSHSPTWSKGMGCAWVEGMADFQAINAVPTAVAGGSGNVGTRGRCGLLGVLP